MQRPVIEAMCRWSGIGLTPSALERLVELEGWMTTEAVAAGGIGPNEVASFTERHTADALSFAAGWRGTGPPGTMADLGSGVGLPALPLAIAHPDSRVVAIDKSGKRCRLLRRAVRVLAIDNVDVWQADFGSLRSGAFEAVVSRAAMPPQMLRPHLERLVAPGGVGVVGGSHVTRPEVAGYETLEIPTKILDRAAWLLIMAPPVRRPRL